MKKILSIFLNIDRAYLTGITIDESGVSLDYINSTIHHIDLENFKTEESRNGVAEMNKFFFEMDFEPDEISVTLPSESVLVSKFPGKHDITDDELTQLLNLEIRQLYPQCDPKDYTTYAVPMLPDNPKLHQMMAVIVPNEDFKALEELVQILNKPIVKFDITQLNAHTCFLYNYPEMVDKNIIFVCVQGHFMDVSVLSAGKPIYYNLLAVSDFKKVGEFLEKEYDKIVPNYVDEIHACYFFGVGLTKEINMMLWETASLLGIFEAKRLNSFRMLKSNLSKREKEYCSRTLHIYPACIGAGLPAQHKILNVE
ncbi:MAG: hypothetical protein KIT33_14775 [Candidatus Kapabacteria bacterium]|nr:hypothetical protein [Ignavibacteriota bacterium]MCW5886232.1 hypothetical protein [Candidatus Kapabacteria bacterium]